MTAVGITFAKLDALRAGRSGTVDTLCPLCGPDRRSPLNRKRRVLRTWMPNDGFISYSLCALRREGLCARRRTGHAEPRAVRAALLCRR